MGTRRRLSWALTGALLSALAVTLNLTACRPGENAAPPTQALFLPPTLAATPTARPRPTPTPPPPSPTPPCEPNLSFLEDLTIPDGTVTEPGAELDKRWQVRNAGSCNWDARYQIRLVSGPPLGAETEQALFPARSGTDVEVRILFTAPTEAGVYRSIWQAFDPAGAAFGDPIYIEIQVTDGETSSE